MAYFEELASWQKAKELTLYIYSLMQDVKDYGFRDQIQRASVSIMNNIAEGSDYNSTQMFIKFLKIAKGSCAEVRSMIYLCKELNYCTDIQFDDLLNKCRKLSSTLNKHIKYLDSIT